MFIYIIAEKGGPCKVGRASDVNNRLESLQGGNPRLLELVWHRETPHPVAVERMTHSLLLRHRIRGEWFSVLPREAIEAAEKAVSWRGDSVAAKVPNEPELSELIASAGPFIDHRKDWRGALAQRKRLAAILREHDVPLERMAQILVTRPDMIERWLGERR